MPVHTTDGPAVADWEPPPPGLAECIDPRFTDHAALDLVRRQPRGRVRTVGGADPVRVVVQPTVAYPGRRILVLVPRRTRVREVRRQLAGQGVRRVAVATPERAFAVRPEAADLVVVLDPHELSAGPDRHALDVLRSAAGARLVAVTPDRNLPPRLRLLTVALFGPAEVLVPGHGLVPRPTTLEVLQVVGGHWPTETDPAELQRVGGTPHRVRNALLARQGADEAAVVGRRVVVLADGAEHALRPLRLLPAAAMAVGAAAWRPDGMSAARQAALAAGRTPGPADRPVIATAPALVRLPVPDVLARADGGGGPPPLPLRWTACRPGEAVPLLVMGADDRHHPALRQRAQARVMAARSAGWRVAGDRPPTALGWFAAARGDEPDRDGAVAAGVGP